VQENQHAATGSRGSMTLDVQVKPVGGGQSALLDVHRHAVTRSLRFGAARPRQESQIYRPPSGSVSW
jgi:ribosomal protein S9